MSGGVKTSIMYVTAIFLCGWFHFQPPTYFLDLNHYACSEIKLAKINCQLLEHRNEIF